MLGHGTIGQFAIGEVGPSAGAEFIGPDKFMRALSEPVRFKKGLRAAQQQFSALSDPFPFVSFSWFEELSKPPVLKKNGLRSSQQQFLAFQPAPSPFVATGWFEALSEPARKKPGLRPSLQQFFTTDPTVIPVSTVLNGWFSPLSEPVRQKLGLKASRQQFLASPSRLLPTPTLFGVLDALETKDTMLAGALVWNRITDTEIGVVNTTPQPAEIGLFPASQPTGTITVRISVIIG